MDREIMHKFLRRSEGKGKGAGKEVGGKREVGKTSVISTGGSRSAHLSLAPLAAGGEKRYP
jgi:hypothetical protein